MFDEIRQLIRAGDDLAAIERLSTVEERAREPGVRGRALMLKIGCVINIGRLDECPALIDRAFDVLAGTDEHALRGGVHALASFVAAQGSMQRCVRHMVQGWRELDRVEHPGPQSVDASYNLAVSLSYTGFHSQARQVAESTYWLGQRLGLPDGEYALPEVAVRHAVAHDHRGDTATCVRALRAVLDTWSKRTEPQRMWVCERHHFGYAMVRLAALGEPQQVDRSLFSADAAGWEMSGLRVFIDACLAIVDGTPSRALALLESVEIHPFTLGAAEVPRLRGLAHESAGDYRAACRAHREASRLATELTDHLRDRLVDDVRAQLDHEVLRHTVEEYEAEALTDPLTGLPNRRHFERRVARLREPGAVAIIDLDDFKNVNTVHGHGGGDLVLQRVAQVLVRSIRPGDFVARYGGDEFLLLLPKTDVDTAHALGRQLVEGVSRENWNALVPGTPVSISVGCAPVAEPKAIELALRLADHAMLRRKTERVPVG